MIDPITTAQMRALEQGAIASGDVTGLELMERAGQGVLDAALASANLPPLDGLPAILREALQREVEADGRLEMAFTEIPVLGELVLSMKVTPS